MKAFFDVIRFHNEDVIATSMLIPDHGGSVIVVPDGVCAQVGVLHFFTTSRGRYDAANDVTTASGVSYIYNAPGDLSPTTGSTMAISGRQRISAGNFYYYDGNTYILCDPQAHAHTH